MGCECDCNTETKTAPALREMTLEFLYLDEAACAPCGETAAEAERGCLCRQWDSASALRKST